MSDVPDTEPSASTPAAPGTPEVPPAQPERELSADERHRNLLRKKRTEYLDHLLRNLDMIVWGHLTYLYLLDCSFWRFLVRSVIQLQWLTPKPASLPAVPLRRSVVFALLGSSAFCTFYHIFSAAPSAGEQSYGYLHGGLIIDFIGQEGPVSKLRLVLVDFVVLALQVAMLSIVAYKQDLQLGRTAAGPSGETAAAAPTMQDSDAEERGERRSTEMDPLLARDVDGVEPETERRRGELERRTFEIMSGEMRIIAINLVDTIRRQWQEGNGVTVAEGGRPRRLSPAEVLLRGRSGVA